MQHFHIFFITILVIVLEENHSVSPDIVIFSPFPGSSAPIPSGGRRRSGIGLGHGMTNLRDHVREACAVVEQAMCITTLPFTLSGVFAKMWRPSPSHPDSR